MSVITIILLAWIAIGTLNVVAQIGKPREPITPGQAVGSIVMMSIFAALVAIA